MDPDTVYNNIKTLLKKENLSEEEQVELSNAVESLENWINSGGFLPSNFNIHVLEDASYKAF